MESTLNGAFVLIGTQSQLEGDSLQVARAVQVSASAGGNSSLRVITKDLVKDEETAVRFSTSETDGVAALMGGFLDDYCHLSIFLVVNGKKSDSEFCFWNLKSRDSDACSDPDTRLRIMQDAVKIVLAQEEL